MSPRSLEALYVASCALLPLGVFILAYALGHAPALEGKRLGLRGLKRRRALDQLVGFALIEPCIRWIGARCSWLPETWRRKASRDLALAGDALGLLPEEFLGLSLLSCLCGGSVGWLLAGPSGLGNAVIVAGLFGGGVLPQLHIAGRAGERMKQVNRRLPYAIDVLALAMGAGLDFPGSLQKFVEKSGTAQDALVEELTLVLQSLQLGRTRRQALTELAERVPSEGVREFVGAVVQAELRGNPLAAVLSIQAEVARRKRTVRAEERAARAGVAMLAPLLLVFIAILIIIVAPVVLQLHSSGF
jgi:tight adherence protein C